MPVTDELPYDGDLHDPKQRCQHGTFIGSWWGPDYLCGWCEDGISVEEMHQIQAEAAQRRITNRFEKAAKEYAIIMEAIAANPQVPYSAAFATALVNWIWEAVPDAH